MDPERAARLTQLAGGRELLEYARDVAAREAIVVAADDVGQDERGQDAQDRRAHEMEPDQRPHAVIDPDRLQPRAGEVSLAIATGSDTVSPNRTRRRTHSSVAPRLVSVVVTCSTDALRSRSP
jgi:hypothetical protein